ncbi:MAG: CoA-acylating methylmalonate-semialdehyde dehydrogenase [Actinobacteria bacterium]|nr:CoA-acylating methylmalonate-semialdehyde dehydrogenase [Actinomycetota bacterium]
MKRITHWINGEPRIGVGDRHAEVYNPAIGEATGRVDFATAEEVDQAVAAAAGAFTSWRTTSLTKRTRTVFAFRNLVEKHRGELARLISEEHGKVVADADAALGRGLDVVDFACGIPHLLKGEFSENSSSGIDSYSIRQPVGVVAGVTPFNFPAMVPMCLFPVAIACGNTFVLKPSEKDPSASVRLAELWAEAGLPDGVFNVVQGDKAAVDCLLEHADVQAVSFVGSSPVARHIYETATHNGKRVQALGSAKNHMVVLPDANVDRAADAAIGAAYGSAGERCMSISVVVAVGSAADPFVEQVIKRAAELRVGPGDDPLSEMGPLITGQHRDRVARYLDAGVEAGATLALDGRNHQIFGAEGGFWLGPSLFDHVSADMSIYTDEIFGPVLSVVRADTLDSALELVNASPYGNGASIFTGDGAAARRFQSEVQVGMVGINVPIPVPVAYYSFGGWKDSLFGDTHMYGPEGVHFYTRGKVVTSRWAGMEAQGRSLGFPAHT